MIIKAYNGCLDACIRDVVITSEIWYVIITYVNISVSL